MERANSTVRFVLGATMLTLLTACAAKGPYVLELMPAPTVYQDEDFSPFADDFSPESLPYRGMLYVTDRRPAGGDEPPNPADPHYVGKRGEGLRAGVASIQLGEGGFTWEAAQRWSTAEVDRAIAAAYDADKQLKSTTISDARGVLTTLLLRLARPESA